MSVIVPNEWLRHATAFDKYFFGGKRMADIVLNRTHHLGLKGARAAADRMAKKLDEKFDLTSEWQGDTLHFHRAGVNGRLAVSNHDMKLDVSLGFMLKMMKGPIEKAIHEQLDNVLDPAAAVPDKTPVKATAGTKKPAAKKK